MGLEEQSPVRWLRSHGRAGPGVRAGLWAGGSCPSLCQRGAHASAARRCLRGGRGSAAIPPEGWVFACGGLPKINTQSGGGSFPPRLSRLSEGSTSAS